jgi:hypothetical protein
VPVDADGYPTGEALDFIQHWPFDAGYDGLLDFVHQLWAYADCGYWAEEDGGDGMPSRPVRIYRVSTAGWSGNEDIVRALTRNRMFWSFCWVESRRGGHFLFHVARRP